MFKKLIKISFLFFVLVSLVVLTQIDLETLFKDPKSFVVFDEQGSLLGGKIAADEQWRFPLVDSLPDNYKKALLCYEDKRYYKHIGVDILAISRAIKLNVKEGRIVSGASTITMQLMRLSRKSESRSLFQKLVETYLAVLYNLKYSKEDLLMHYATHAPFGGNVVGVETASWRYFGRSIHDLSWAESATLAVLPNSPSLIHLGKNRSALKKKRDGLLKRMYEDGIVDSLDYSLAVQEAIPAKPKDLPMDCYHFVEQHYQNRNSKSRIKTRLDKSIQQLALEVLQSHEGFNSSKGIKNAAILIRDTKTGKILSYVGNTTGDDKSRFNDMVLTPRSSGSILKPFLYALMMEEGYFGPKQLVKDVPIHIDGFQPKNYDKSYRGLIPAHEALAKSLNVPFVLMLQEYGIDRFLNRLREFGLTSLDKDADHYGLSLILGGGEVNLYELTEAYALLGRIALGMEKKHKLHQATAFHMFEAMYELQRPNEDNFWESFSSTQEIAWKTGTSYGHRDAWAMAVTPDYTIGIWVGNSTGEARPEIIGSSIAGPILFDLIPALPEKNIFKEPLKVLKPINICSVSGLKKTKACLNHIQSWLSPSLDALPSCNFHRSVLLDKNTREQVHRSCESSCIDTSWFVINPKEAQFYKQFNPSYEALPNWRIDCADEQISEYIDIVYPHTNSSFVIPKNLNEEKEALIFEVAHQYPKTKVYWHLDDHYLGYTEEMHKMSVNTGPGKHLLSVVDEKGKRDKVTFEVLQ